MAFSPDGRLALTACADGNVQLWDTPSHRPVGVPLRHQRAVLDASFSPDGKAVLSGGKDNTARLWSIPSAMEGEIERVLLFAQVITGAELDESDVVHVLDPPTWHARRRRLEEIGRRPLSPREVPGNR